MKRRTYDHGLDVMGADFCPWWETTAIVVGALASLATLFEVTRNWRRR